MRFWALLLCCCTLFPAAVFAQFDATLLTEQSISLQLQPSYPSPGEQVKVSLDDYRSTNFGSSIRWFIDGTAVAGADNQRNITLTAPAAGQSQEIKAVLTSPLGTTDTITHVVTPLYLDIILEPQTHVPDFYKGRALPSIGSTVNATAILSKGSILGNDLVYKWTVNDVVLASGPVRGMNKTSFIVPQGNEVIVTLQVSSLQGNTIARRSLLIPSVRPELYFYEVNPLYGMSYRALTAGLSMIGNSTTLKAEPYFLDTQVYNNPSLTEWSINGRTTPTYDRNPYELTLERTGNSGVVDIGFHVRSTDVLLQGARDTMELNF